MAPEDTQKTQKTQKQGDFEMESEADTPATSSCDDIQDISAKMAPVSIDDVSVDVEAHALTMQQRCKDLWSELEQFQDYLRQQKKESSVELRTFKGGLQAEMKLLDKLAAADPSNPKTSHGLRSSNLTFFIAVWETAKSCTSISSFGKRFYWIPGRKAPYINGKVSTSGTAHRMNSAVVDIVAQDGLEWIKVSSKTEKRIIWDLAKAGWVGDSSEESEDEISDEDDDPEGLLKQIEALKKASRATRVRYLHPTIRIVLPRIKADPDSKEVAQVLQKIRDLGVIVETSEGTPRPSAPISDVLSRMAADRFASFSEILNVDCTILLAFASDLSHGRVEPEDWHNKAISRQIEMESEDQLLPNSLWPACGGRELVCTRDAAVRMQEIVDIIGTQTERRRATLMLNLNGDSSLTQEQRVDEFQTLSAYQVPKNWQLPIEIVDFEPNTTEELLHPVAEKVAEGLTAINRSVFFFGWATNKTTISSNRAVAKEIENTIEENRNEDDEGIRGPDIWLCPTSRSLVGKEKQRRGFSEAGCQPGIAGDLNA